MPPVKITCANPNCRAALELDALPAAGKKVRCPRCSTAFAPAEAAAAPGPIALLPEEGKVCPSCRAAMAPEAVLCIECGFNLKTGQKLEAAKKSPKRRKKPDRQGPLTEGDLPDLLKEADILIDLASKELRRLPHVLGLGDDPGLAGLRSVASRPNRCDNPNCQTSLTNLDESNWYVRVSFRAGGHMMVVNLCQTCAEVLHADLASRSATAQAYLDEARGDLERAARRFPKDPDVKAALQEVHKVELLAAAEDRIQQGRRRRCFIATAAYGSPLADEVGTLRRYRDEVLERSPAGRCLTRAYYLLSPPLAALVAAHPAARALVRRLLAPLVGWCGARLAGPRTNNG
jgi:predicted Zn finger-like uncharacterized protein